MNPNIATTIEESKRLLDAGLNPETADMHLAPSGFIMEEGEWLPRRDKEHVLKVGPCENRDDIPAWSIAALWDIYYLSNIPYCNYGRYGAEELKTSLVRWIILGIEDGEIVEPIIKTKNNDRTA